MIIELSDTERAAMLVAWRTGRLDTDKIAALEQFAPARRLTTQEAAELWQYLDENAELPPTKTKDNK